jgi:hypothetical protein
MEKQIYNSTINGSLSGGFGYILTLPLDAIKQNIQTGNKIVEKNIKNYFRGGVLGVTSIVPQMAIKFTSNTYLENKYKLNPLINGFIAGTLDGAFLGPLLASQSLQQMNSKLSYKDTYLIIKNKSIFQMALPMALRNGIYTSVLIGGYKLIPNKKNTFMQDLFYASLLNIPGSFLCNPADIIRARKTKYLLENKNINFKNIVKDIYSQEGIKGFFKNYKVLYINFALRFPLTLAIFNYLQSYKFQ